MRRKELPEVGELVVATVREVYDYGAYLNLDEYGGMEAYLPWSEVASRWVKSIHDVVRPDMKIVVRVIRVNKSTGQVDVSLKRVTDSERRRKMMEWKRLQKATKILEIVAQKMGKTLGEAYSLVGSRLVEVYGELMTAFEDVVIRGEQALREAGIPEEWVKPLLEEAKRHVEVKHVRVVGTVSLKSYAGDGVERVRSVLSRIKSVVEAKYKDVRVRLYATGAPRYRVELEGYDYKVLEHALEEAIQAGAEEAKRLGVEFSFTREKLGG